MEHLVFVVTSMGRGGAERVISILSNHYASKNYKVHIVMLWHNKIEYELNDAIVIHDLSNDKHSPYINLFRVVAEFRKLVKSIKPKTVVSFIAQNNIVSYFACLGNSAKLVLSERLDPKMDTTRGPLMRAVIKFVYLHADTTVFQTTRAKAYFGAKMGDKGVIIGNPVDIDQEAVREKIDRSKIVTVGRLEPQKNHKLLLNAFKRVLDFNPDYRLYIYGDGQLKQSLVDSCIELNIIDSVHFMGMVKDVQKQIADSAMFVLSSDFEGLSNSLLEAMMLGIPCISTDCAGSEEVIINGNTGLIAPIGNEEILYSKMKEFIENPQLADRCGMNAKQYVSSKYCIGKVLMDWDNVII